MFLMLRGELWDCLTKRLKLVSYVYLVPTHIQPKRQHFYSSYLNGYTETTYIQALKEIIVGDMDPANIILLEIYPEQQKTRIDFYCTEKLLGVKTVCITKLIGKENKLYYEDNGQVIQIKRIYNRLIFDFNTLPLILDL